MYLTKSDRFSVKVAFLKSHSVRIGGHTFFKPMSINPDLTDYLCQKKVSRYSLCNF